MAKLVFVNDQLVGIADGNPTFSSGADDGVVRVLVDISEEEARKIKSNPDHQTSYGIVSIFDPKKVDLEKLELYKTPDYIGFVEAILPTEDETPSNLDKLLDASQNQVARLRVESAILHLLVNAELALKLIIVEFNRMLAGVDDENLVATITNELNTAFLAFSIPVSFSENKLIRDNESTRIQLPPTQS